MKAPAPLTDTEIDRAIQIANTAPDTEVGRLIYRLVDIIDFRAALPPTAQPSGHDSPTVAPQSEALREALNDLPRLWWCGGWGTLNAKRYHGNDGPCALDTGTCGLVAYVRDSDLRAALREDTDE